MKKQIESCIDEMRSLSEKHKKEYREKTHSPFDMGFAAGLEKAIEILEKERW